MESKLQLPNTLKDLKGYFKTHQIEGIIKGIGKNGRFLLADPPGMGKSRQALAVSKHFLNEYPGICLVITKCSIVGAWKSECDRLNLSSEIFDSKSTFQSNFIIINYEKLDKIVNLGRKPKPKRRSLKFAKNKLKIKPEKLEKKLEKKQKTLDPSLISCIIIDESHKIKNVETNCFKMVEKLSHFAKSLICISGTPMLSRPSELFSQLKLINPSFMSFDNFISEYCDGGSGLSNSVKLKEMLNSQFLIRRTSKILNLIKRKRTLIMIDLPVTLDRSLEFIEQFNILPYYKCGIICLFLKKILHRDMKKTIIFGHHKIMLESIKKLVEFLNINYIFIDGSTTKRECLINTFQNDSSCKVAIMSINACNTGITLTAATEVIFTEMEMNPADIIQAEGRACRIGQEKEVTITFLIAKNSIEESIFNLILGKERRVDLLNLLEEEERIEFDKMFKFDYIMSEVENVKQSLNLSLEKPLPSKKRFFTYKRK